MEELSEKELEQQRRLELFRKQALIILRSHVVLLSSAFVLFLVGVSTLAYLRVKLSSDRYVARLSMHYYPKQPGKIRPYDEKFLLQLFNRPALLAKFRDALNKREFGVRASGTVQVNVEKKKNSSFVIVLHARTGKEAVEFINGFAHYCMREYAEKRTQDLKEWESVLQKKKKDVFNQIQKLNHEKESLTASAQVFSPEKDYERLRNGLTSYHSARLKLSFVVKNLKSRQERLRKELQKFNPMLLEKQKEIRERLDEIKKLDREISIAQELYTEANPKLMSLLSRRQAQRRSCEEFLKTCGLSFAETMSLDSAEKLHADLLAGQEELENREQALRVLESEFAVNQKTFETLARILPRYRELNQQAASLRDSLQKLDESLADINYLLVLVKDDLFITEKAVTAIGQQPLSKKSLAVAVFAAVALTGFTAVLLILLDLLFGSLISETEMSLHPELQYMGRLPVTKDMFPSDVARDLVFNSVTHRIQNAVPNGHIVLVGALPGAKILPEFFPAVEWTYAMSGQRVLLVDIVLAGMAGPDFPMNDDMGIIACSGNKGILPIASKKYIDPAELELLKQDLVTLRKNYDVIFFRHSFVFRHDRLFLEQFIPLCDGLLIAAGLRKTARQMLRSLVTLQRETGMTIMTLLTDRDAKHFTKIMDMENQA